MRFFKIRFVGALAMIALAAIVGRLVLLAQAPVTAPTLLIHAPANGVGFGSIGTNATSPQTTITLQNIGNGPLTVQPSTAPVAPLTDNDFNIVFSNCATVAAGGYCTVGVTFTPTANGTRTARLLLQTNASSSAYVVPLVGQGVDPALAQPSVGPIDARTGFPYYFSDGKYALELCLDHTPPLDAAGNPVPQTPDPLVGLTPTMCLGPTPDPSRPPAVTDDPATTNFGAEAFWWSTEAAATPVAGAQETDLLIVMAQEAAFTTEDPKAGDQWGFGRLRFRVDTAVANARYRFTHPFGVDIFAADDRRVFATSDIGCFSTPCDFTLALPGSTRISNFLACASPAPPAGYLGDPNQQCTVTGSPLGTNFFRVERESSPGSNTWILVGETNLFAVSGKLTVPITPPPPSNQGPNAVDDVATTPYNTPVIIAVMNNDTDPNAGDVLNITTVTSGANGTAAINGTTITYTPSSTFTAGGIDTFQYAIADQDGLTDTATVRVTVGAVPPPNRAPTAVNDAFMLLPDLIFFDPQMFVSAPGVLDNDIDLDNNALSIELVSGPPANPDAPGFPTLSLSPDGSFIYNHGVGIAEGASPTPVVFTYRATDGVLFSNVASVTINVTRPVGQPIANDDAISTPMDTAITHDVDFNDTNGSANATTNAGIRQPSLTIQRQAANGQAVVVRPDPALADRQVRYTPNAGFTGVDTFTYTVVDNQNFTSNVATVTVTVIGGPTQVAVPNLVNQTQAAAQQAIVDAGLAVGAITLASSGTVPSGSVISSNPEAGTLVDAGSAVALLISTGVPPVAVPNVVNLTQTAAEQAITGAGLTVGAVTQASSATVPSGSVISSNPGAGTLVAPGSAVALVISTGPAQVAVPNVVNQTQIAAEQALTGAGLTVGAVTQASSATVPSGSVISSDPGAGTLVAPGSAVALVISTGATAAVPTQVSMVFSQGTGNRTVAVSTTTPGVRLVAFVGADGPSGANNQAVTVSGGGLTWTRVRQQRQRSGVAEIWTAVAPTVLTNASVTSTLSSIGNFPQQITVVGFTNVSSIGAVGGASTPGTTAVPASASLVTEGEGSLVYGVGLDWSVISAHTVGAGQTKLREYIAATFIASWVQRLNGVTGAAGSTVTLNTTAPNSSQWNMAVVELRR